MDQRRDMGIDIVERDGCVVVVVEGEVDLCAAPEFRAWITRAGASGAPAIVLDLDRVSFMDSAAVHVLLQFSISEPVRGRLAVTQGSAQVRRMLELTGVRRHLRFGAAPAFGAGSGGP